MPGAQQENDTGGAQYSLQNRNAAGHVVAMKGHENTREDTAPEIHGDGDRGDQESDAGGLLQRDRG